MQSPPPVLFPVATVNINFTADDLIIPLKRMKEDTKQNFTRKPSR